MESWYYDNLASTKRIMLLDLGYINDELAVEWLQHFIVTPGPVLDS
jgi:hypothetical protein